MLCWDMVKEKRVRFKKAQEIVNETYSNVYRLDIACWPKYMPILETSEFIHGAWESPCKTARCAVGNIAIAFNLNPTRSIVDYFANYRYKNLKTVPKEILRPGWDEDGVGGLNSVASIGSPMHKFAKKFAENMLIVSEFTNKSFKKHMREFDLNYQTKGLNALDSLFEFGILAKSAADAWNKTIKHFGYSRVLSR